MALRALFVIIRPQHKSCWQSWCKALSVPSFGSYWKQLILNTYQLRIRKSSSVLLTRFLATEIRYRLKSRKYSRTKCWKKFKQRYKYEKKDCISKPIFYFRVSPWLLKLDTRISPWRCDEKIITSTQTGVKLAVTDLSRAIVQYFPPSPSCERCSNPSL